MKDDDFEWDDAKAALNLARHGVSFEVARLVFDDAFAVVREDRRQDYGEERFVLLGAAAPGCCLYDARRSDDVTMKKTAECPPKIDWSRADAMTAKQRRAAAMSDPNNKPMTDKEWSAAPRVPQIRVIRRALKLSQEEFAASFQIPIGTLRDWEQGRKEPDAAARAYLRVIAREPDTVRRALTLGRRPPVQRSS
jgi:putative transcriptional regulator